MTSEEKELLEFAKMQRFANGTNDENDLFEAFGKESAPEVPAKLNRFDDETKVFILEGIASVTKPLIDEISRLTNLSKSEKEIEADKEKSENEAEISDFVIMQSKINEVE